MKIALPPLPGFLRRASLGVKLAVILSAAGAIGFAGILALLMAIITPNFSRLEAVAVEGHIDRTRAALEEYASKVEIAVKDYGVWDDSYKYMYQGGTPFVDAVFSVLAFTNLDINGMAYVDNDGKIVYSRYVDLERQADDAELAEAFNTMIRSHSVRTLAGKSESAHFYARLGERVVAVGIAKVLRSDGSGISPGYVAMARQISSQQLSHLIQLKARFGVGRAHQKTAVLERPRTLDIAVDIDGLNRVHIANATFVVPRDYTLLGQRMLWLTVFGTAGLLVIVLLVLRQMIGRLVISPLAGVERHMQDVSASGQLHLLDDQKRADEIGSLVRSFNAMLAQLKDLREQVEIQSFKLGQSESAIGVMHNVRNGLNPISVIVSQGMNAQPVIAHEDANRALGELARDDTSPVRRQKLAAFLVAALETHRAQSERRREDLVSARSCLNNVLEIIGHQQSIAHERIDTEPCDVLAVIEQNAALARYAATGQVDFSCPEDSALVDANRILLSQVIGNLFANAIESIASAGCNPGRISVAIDRFTRPDGEVVEIRIADNGEGFDHAQSLQLFRRGFSSRKQKSGGLGLHWCANSINAMHGTLTLVSGGPGQGATATITLRAAALPKDDRTETSSIAA
ncbi:CHASE4 domain-containing protein [Sphingomonas sp. KC8]|uniref:CHASE4 domain-containing protein n=1 Tax=Sphingomonas sp. KC8 TaxID=1030157 RepID=UPI0002489F6F|nr:CHASE4 domain-containing protein [Sphingomonas sp. KC8]ARS28057.1 histidine kinase [Sphingomonas sp. KC8]